VTAAVARPASQLARARAWLADHQRNAWAVDLRAVALGRIALGGLIVADVGLRLDDAVAHYSDLGFVQRAQMGAPENPAFRIYFLSGDPDWATLLLVLTGVVGLLFAVGLFTRVSGALAWLLLASLHGRNGWVLQAGDFLLVNLLFWVIFLPAGARFGLDARRAATTPPTRVYGPAATALFAQLVILYVMAGMAKAAFPHWWRGEGVSYALQADHFVTAFGRWLADFDALAKLLSWATLALELVVPWALLVDLGWRFRAGLVAVFVAFHLALEAALGIGLFSYVCIAGWLLVIPTEAIDRWKRHAGTEDDRKGARDENGALALAPASARWAGCLAAAFLAYAVLLAVAQPHLAAEARRAVEWPARIFAHGHRWGVFSGPRENSGWFVVDATLADGRHLDVLRGASLSWARPESVRATFPNQRWRKLYSNFPKPRSARPLALYLEWLCRRDESIVEVKYVHVRHAISLDGDRGPDERHVVARRRCARAPAAP
jgi:hypothetical protein